MLEELKEIEAKADELEREIRIEPEPTTSHMHNFLECVRSRQKPRALLCAASLVGAQAQP